MATALLSLLADRLRPSLPFAAFACRPVFSASPQLLTTRGPLALPLPASSQFVWRRPLLRSASTRCSTSPLARRAAVLRDISAGTSYLTARLVFRPYTQLWDRSARQNPFAPPPAVTPASGAPGIVRRLSGRSHRAPLLSAPPLSLRARPSPPYTRAVRALLGPCYKTGLLHALALCSLPPGFTPFHSASAVLFSFPSRYFFAIGLPPYLAFVGMRHRLQTAFPLSPTSLEVPPHGALTLSGAPFLATCMRPPQPCLQVSVRAPPSSLAATAGISVDFFSSRY